MTTPSTEGPDTSSSEVASGNDTPALLAGSRVASTLQTLSHRVSSWIQSAALFQWFTAEPDPEVIVIDLRETWTVGPILRVLDWVIDRLVDAAVGSRFVDVAQRGVATAHAAPMRLSGICVATLGIVVAGGSLLGGVSTTRLAVGVGLAIVGLIGMQDDRDWTTLRETHPVELAIAVFAPPEPPDATDDEGKIGQSRADPNESSEPRIAADADESLSPASGSEDSAKASDSDRQ